MYRKRNYKYVISAYVLANKWNSILKRTIISTSLVKCNNIIKKKIDNIYIDIKSINCSFKSGYIDIRKATLEDNVNNTIKVYRIIHGIDQVIPGPKILLLFDMTSTEYIVINMYLSMEFLEDEDNWCGEE